MSRPALLIVDPHPLWPPNHGWAVRDWNLVRRLSERFRIHLLVFTGGSDDPAQRRALEPWCAAVHFQHYDVEAERRGDVSGSPLPAAARPFVRPDVRDRIVALVTAHRIDAVLLQGTHLAGLLDGGFPVPVAVTAIDLLFETELHRLRARFGHADSTVQRALGPREWYRLLRYELAGLDRARQIHCMSEANARLLARVAPRLRTRIRVVPNGVDTREFAPPAEEPPARAGVLMLGSFPHPPNTDAARYFLREIWPRVRARAPEARLTLAGAEPPDWVEALKGRDGITVAGEVDDVRPLFWSHALLAAPLRAGSGTRIKILEAMGAGLPVVSTRIGAAGIDAANGREIVLVDGARRFADEVVSLLADRDRARRLAEAARRFAIAHFDWDAIAARAADAIEELTVGGKGAPAGSVSSPVDAPTPAEPDPEIDVLVPWPRGGRNDPELFDLLATQASLPFRVRFLADAPPSSTLAEELRRGFDWLVIAAESDGARIDEAIRRSAARCFAILDPAHRPASHRWLADLTWALFQPVPAAAVAGTFEPRPELPGAEPGPGVPRPAGALSNLALRRETWASFPFGEAPGAFARFERQLAEANQQLFRSPHAPVFVAPALVQVVDPDSGAAPVASVILCTRDRGAGIAPTLRGLAAQTARFPWEVIVVDNGSNRRSRGELEAAAEASWIPVRIVDEPTVGLSPARNRGALVARGAIVAYLDDDAVPEPRWLEALVGAFDEPGVEDAGGPVDPLWEGVPPAWLGRELLPYLTVWDRGGVAHDLAYNETPRGANFAVRRSTFERVGFFSRHLGRRGTALRSCEETELALRIERTGGRSRYVPDARVAHLTRANRLSPEWMEARFFEQGLSEAIVDWMHFGGRHVLGRARWPPPSPPASPGDPALSARLARAAVRGYRRGAAIAALSVPRWHPKHAAATAAR